MLVRLASILANRSPAAGTSDRRIAPSAECVTRRPRFSLKSAVVAGLLLAAIGPGAVANAAADRVKTDHAEAVLFTADAGLAPGVPSTIGLQLTMKPGWHVYWQNPGDSGAPPTISWTLPQGVDIGEISWPVPRRLPYGPLVNFGYEGTLVLQMPIVLSDTLGAERSVPIRGDATWLICEEICVPESASFSLELTVTPNEPVPDPVWSEVVDTAQMALPTPSPWPAAFRADDDGFTIGVAAAGLDAGRIVDVSFFPFRDGLIENAAPQSFAISETGLAIRTRNGVDARTVADGVAGVLSITERLQSGIVATQGFLVDADRTDGLPPGASALTHARGSIQVWQALIFALLGGLILNVMPCVFPVLSMKALTLVKTAERSPGAARASGIAYTAGVLLAFGALAGALLVLKSTGLAIGWGFQLQSPTIVGALALILFVVGLNLSGVFEVRLSTGAGQSLAGRAGPSGSFFTGILAAVVAAPCTAPFMAAATGFAVTQPAAIAMTVFLALGFGLALPYLVIALVPALRQLLPKPGAWMSRMRELLAFPMYGSAVWLVWVLGQQAGPDGVLAVLSAMVLMALGLWLYEATRGRGRIGRSAGMAGAALALGLTLGLLNLPQSVPVSGQTASATSTPSGNSEPFSAARLAEAQAQGRPVLINFTAAWCITCLVNERVALSNSAVSDALERTNTLYLKGDWTNYDPEITAVLERFGRSGVPLYVLFPGAGTAADPVVLPQILTIGMVVAAIETNAGNLAGS